MTSYTIWYLALTILISQCVLYPTHFLYPAKWIWNRSVQLGKHLLWAWFSECLKHEWTWQSIHFDISTLSIQQGEQATLSNMGLIIVLSNISRDGERILSKQTSLFLLSARAHCNMRGTENRCVYFVSCSVVKKGRQLSFGFNSNKMCLMLWHNWPN